MEQERMRCNKVHLVKRCVASFCFFAHVSEGSLMNVEQVIYTCKPTEMSEGVAALTDEMILSCVLMVGRNSA